MTDLNKSNIATRVLARVGIIFLTWRRYQQQGLVPHHITLKQVYVLRRLAHREFLYPSKIADFLFCDRPTATVVIRNMEKQGWVSRRRDDQDRRQVRIVITAAGRTKVQELNTRDLQDKEFDPLACFDENELCELDRLLGKMSDHMKQIRRKK